MSEREVPERLDAAIFRGAGRTFQTRSAAYYAISKKIIGAKYPPSLRRHAGGEDGRSELDVADEFGVSVLMLRERSERVVDLFYTRESGESHFDADKWMTLVRRLARFLKFVDRRRAELRREATPTRRKGAAIGCCPGCGGRLRPCEYAPLPDVGTIEVFAAAGRGHYSSGFCSMRCGWRFAVAFVRSFPGLAEHVLKLPDRNPGVAELVSPTAGAIDGGSEP